jgi:hypothetical protein
MNYVEFGFDRSRGFGSARGQFWPIAIDRSTRPYNIASTTVQQVTRQSKDYNKLVVKELNVASLTFTDDLTRATNAHG